jgi:hypothetical protein
LTDLSAIEKAQSDRLREESNASLKAMGEWIGTQLGNHLKVSSDAQKEQLAGFVLQLRTLNESSTQDAGQLREQLFKSFTQFSDLLVKQVSESTTIQGQRFDQFETRLSAFSTNSTAQISKMRETIESRLTALQEDSTQKWGAKQTEDLAAATQARQELNESLQRLADTISKNFSAAGEAQRGHFDSFTARIDKISDNADKRLESLRGVVDERLKSFRTTTAKSWT